MYACASAGLATGLTIVMVSKPARHDTVMLTGWPGACRIAFVRPSSMTRYAASSAGPDNGRGVSYDRIDTSTPAARNSAMSPPIADNPRAGPRRTATISCSSVLLARIAVPSCAAA